MNDHKFKVGVFNRTVSKVDHFLENEAKGTEIEGYHSIEELCKNLKSPKRVMLLVKAGKAVDDFIEMIIPHLSKGDIIIVRFAIGGWHPIGSADCSLGWWKLSLP